MAEPTTTIANVKVSVSPLDDLSITNVQEALKSCPPLRWGILGCGRISHDFCRALQSAIPTAEIVACAAGRSLENAKTFAQEHGISNYYGSYAQLVENSQVEIVYVGNLHAFRRSTGELCLRANKHVLLEKPFAVHVEDAEYLIQLAKERNLFLMEGMWTRFFPAVEHARRLLLEEKVIGEVVSVVSDFNFNASDSDAYPTSFFYNHKLGGGASYLVGPYPLALVLLGFPLLPAEIKVVGQVDPQTGVDLQVAAVLSFPPHPKGGVAPALDESNTEEQTPKLPGCGNATIHFGFLGESKEETTFLGTKGRLVLHSPTHCPTTLTIYPKAAGRRGQSTQPVVYHHPLPESSIPNNNSPNNNYVYPNSAGLAYEAAAAARCIASKKLETPQYTLAETLQVCKLVQEMRRQLGVAPMPLENPHAEKKKKNDNNNNNNNNDDDGGGR